jgi:DNA (cytosine-5)-methyltransferase 1
MSRPTNHTTYKKTSQPPLRVVELFAGVGGFRLGLCDKNKKRNKNFETVWFNQWEPSTKRQHAHEVYISRFQVEKNEMREYSNINIAEVVRAAQCGKFKFPDHDILVGGFPCQDYSVARKLSQATGIAGKKGVLWWEIRNILELKQRENKPVKYLFLENVDRLLKSPASQRGRDFAVMLSTLADLGYAVEWRVINAADYGMPQRRRRIFIVGYHMSSPLYKLMSVIDPHYILMKKGVFASAFPVTPRSASVDVGSLVGNYADITERFNSENPSASPFHSAGIMRGREFHTIPVLATHNGDQKTLGDVLLDEKDVPEEYFVNGDMSRWKYLKGAKNEPRKGTNGFEFVYTEGSMVFPDSLGKPSRTIVTGEGGKTPSRFKHVVKTPSGRYRRLMPIELERLCMFPDDHTNLPGISDARRAFFMGNALVVGVIDHIGKALTKLHRYSLKDSTDKLQNPTPSPLGPKTRNCGIKNLSL